MAKLLYSATASLDGYIAGPGGDMSWLTEHLGGENPTAERLLANVGAILAGSSTSAATTPTAAPTARARSAASTRDRCSCSPIGRRPSRTRSSRS